MRFSVEHLVFVGLILMVVLTNLIPLYGLYSGSWAEFDIVLLYWIETVIAAAFYVVKIWTKVYRATPWPTTHREWLRWVYRRGKARIFDTVSFVLTFGFFSLLTGLTIIQLFFSDFLDSRILPATIEFLETDWDGTLHWALLGLFLSHLFMLVAYWFANKRFLKYESLQQMPRLYIRTFVLYAVISVAGALQWYGKAWAILLLLIGVKITVDLYFCVLESRQLPRSETAIPTA